jgi:hypothetical protein
MNGRGLRLIRGVLHELDIRRLLALGAGCYIEGYFLRLLERFESTALNRREVREQIFPGAVGGNESEAFRVIEPLYCASCHFRTL